MSEKRDQWGTRLGFIMAAAGSAVGLGNIWKFPYMTGENGGGAFLVLYLVCIVVFGLSLAMAELLLGRMAQKTPVAAFREIAGRAWTPVGGLGVITAFVILSFYIVVAGWTLAYMGYEATGSLAGGSSEDLSNTFNQLVGSTWTPLIYAAIFMVLCVIVVIGGIGAGIERASKLLMPILFLMLIVLVIRSVTLPGAAAGIEFFVVPDLSKITADTLTAAIGQAFFSLSLGMGAMITYGSYLPRGRNLPGDALAVVCLDTSVAVLAGFMILPAMFAAGLSPGDGGAGATFLVLPAVFDSMPAGGLFGLAFFALLAVAALTSAVSLLEVVVCYFCDELGLSRVQATLIAAGVSCLLAIPCSLSFGVMSGATIFGMSFFDLMDYLTSSIALPLGGMLTALCVGWVLGPKAVQAITNDGRLSAPWAGVWLFILRIIAPIGIGWILLQGFFE